MIDVGVSNRVCELFPLDMLSKKEKSTQVVLKSKKHDKKSRKVKY
jgi:hypothetical protein